MKCFIFINPDHPGNYYALFYVLAFVSALVWLMFEGRRRKFPLVPWMMVISTAFLFFMAGSRMVTFSQEEWSYVLRLEAIPYSTARSVVGGLLFCVPGILVARKFLQFKHNMTDAFALAVPLALAVQQLGCLMAGCCVGTPSDLPWAIQYGSYSDAFSLQMGDGLLKADAIMAQPVHPVQVYELITCLVVVFLLSRLRNILKAPGNLFLASLVLFSAFDILLEFVRASSGRDIQWILLGVMLILFFLIRYRENHFDKRRCVQESSHELTWPSIYFLTLGISFVLVSRWMDFLEVVSLNIVMLPLLGILLKQWFETASMAAHKHAGATFQYATLPILLFLPSVIACTSMKPVTPPPSVVLRGIYPGNIVHLLLTSGEDIKRMKVVAIDDSGNMVGNYANHQTVIKAKDIQGIQKLRKENGSSQDLYIIKPGSTISAILQNGSRLKHVKVLAIDSVKITYRKGHHAKSEEVLKSDITSVNVLVADPEGTVGLVLGGLLIGGLVGLGVYSAQRISIPTSNVKCSM